MSANHRLTQLVSCNIYGNGFIQTDSNLLDFTYLGDCPANSLSRNHNLHFGLGQKNDDWNLDPSLPTQTTLGSSGSWLTAIQVSVTPW